MKRLFPLVAAFTLAALLLTSGLFSQSVAQLPPAGSPPSASQKGRQQPLPSPTAETAPPTADIPDPLLDVPPLPKGKVTLVGGTVANIDRIRDRLAIQPFGGGSKMKVFFDERTHIYRDGVEITQAKINKGDRIYVDTMLDGARVFARTIRILTQFGPADARGQLQSFDPRNGNIYMRDELSSDCGEIFPRPLHSRPGNGNFHPGATGHKFCFFGKNYVCGYALSPAGGR